MLSRRALIRTTATVGGGVAVTALLSACGQQTEPAESQAPFTVPASEVPVGGGIVLAQHQTLITQPTEGEFHAFSAVCTHQGCLVSEVQERGAYCGCHSSYFDITSGEAVAGPATEPLPEKTVTVRGDELEVA